MKLGFLAFRLRRMSPREYLFRLRQQLQNVLEWVIYVFYTPAPRTRAVPELEYRFSTATWNRPLVTTKADRLCEGKIDLFSLRDLPLGAGTDFHRDYKSGRSAPLRRFGKLIDYRDGERIGDVKYTWELNRLLFLFPLARAHALTSREKYLAAFAASLTAWLDQNPFPRGINWSSALEAGIRLVNWSLCRLLLRGKLPAALEKRWLRAVYLHCCFISGNFSAYSSANNHRVGEAAGLFTAACVFPRFREAARWRSKAFSILIDECLRQIAPDGVGREQAIWYEHYDLDFFFLVLSLSRRAGIEFPPACLRRLERACEFFAAVRDAGGNVPAIGDGDDGVAFDCNQRETGVYNSLLSTAAAFFARPDLFPAPPDEKTRLFLDLAGGRIFAPPAARPGRPTVFPEGGYVILGKDFGQTSEQKLVFDVGPLGYLMAVHGHADALAFTFSYRGVPVFIDPGTCTYFSSLAWRNYFRSTAAHNTVRVDGRDQSEMADRFMWRNKARARLLSHAPCLAARAAHDGYRRLPDAVAHEREIRYDPEKDEWEIRDAFRARAAHRYELFFHLAPECRAVPEGEAVRIEFPGGYGRLVLPAGFAIGLHRGEERPLLGWVSPAVDVRLPSWTVKAENTLAGNAAAVTRFSVRGRKD